MTPVFKWNKQKRTLAQFYLNTSQWQYLLANDNYTIRYISRVGGGGRTWFIWYKKNLSHVYKYTKNQWSTRTRFFYFSNPLHPLLDTFFWGWSIEKYTVVSEVLELLSIITLCYITFSTSRPVFLCTPYYDCIL